MISSPLIRALSHTDRPWTRMLRSMRVVRGVADQTAEAGEHVASRSGVKFAHGWRELEGAFRTVYQAYLRTGLTTHNTLEMRLTPYQLLPTSDIIVVLREGQVDCTTTLVRDGKLGLPMEGLYSREVSQRRARRRSIAEVSCLAERTVSAGAVSRPVMEIIRFVLQAAVHRGVEELLIAVHPHHAPFYQRLGFVPMGEEKTYEAVCDKPAVALSLDLDLERIAAEHPRTHKMFFSNWHPDELFQRPPHSAEVLKKMQSILRQTTASRPTPPRPRWRLPQLFPALVDETGSRFAGMQPQFAV